MGNVSGCYDRGIENYAKSWTTSQRFHEEMTRHVCSHFVAKASLEAMPTYKRVRKMQSNYMCRRRARKIWWLKCYDSWENGCLGKSISGGVGTPSRVLWLGLLGSLLSSSRYVLWAHCHICGAVPSLQIKCPWGLRRRCPHAPGYEQVRVK